MREHCFTCHLCLEKHPDYRRAAGKRVYGVPILKDMRDVKIPHFRGSRAYRKHLKEVHGIKEVS